MSLLNNTPAESITRRELVKSTGKAILGFTCLASSSSFSANQAEAAALTPAEFDVKGTGENGSPQLTVATCQFPVSGVPAANAEYIRDFMKRGAAAGAHLLHTSECSLSGYAGSDLPTFDKYDWNALRKENAALRAQARELNMWLVLGSAHYLDAGTKPTNSLYLIDPTGTIVDRYDKCFCTTGDQEQFSAGNRLVAHDVRGVRVGLAICYDICWPQLYIAYREMGVTLMIHSMSNSRGTGPNCLDTLNTRQVPTRCAGQPHVGRGQ